METKETYAGNDDHTEHRGDAAREGVQDDPATSQQLGQGGLSERTHIATLVLPFLSGGAAVVEPPSTLPVAPVSVLLSVAFHAASVANK